MDIVTFTNTKVNGAICDEQKYQSHVTSSGVCDTEKLAHEIAENLKDSAAYVGSVFGELAKTIKAHLQLGERRRGAFRRHRRWRAQAQCRRLDGWYDRRDRA